MVQRVEIDIGQQRRDDPTLRCAAAVGHHSPGAVFVFLDDGRTQPALDEPEDAPVADSLGDPFHQLPMGNRIVVFSEIRIDEFRVSLIDALHDCINGLVRPPFGPRPIGLRMKVRFPDRQQQQTNGGLHHSVLDRGYPGCPGHPRVLGFASAP